MTLAVEPRDVEAFRPCYRFLSYVLSRRGYTIGDDLYGDDRPEEANRFYRDAQRWLNG